MSFSQTYLKTHSIRIRNRFEKIVSTLRDISLKKSCPTIHPIHPSHPSHPIPSVNIKNWGQKKKWTDHPSHPSIQAGWTRSTPWLEARRPGNPEVLVKRQLTDIPVSIYFFRTPAFLMYFYNGPFHAICQRNLWETSTELKKKAIPTY